MAKKKTRRLAVFDVETDPFEYGTEIKPFAAGFLYETKTPGVMGYKEFWGDDCIGQFVAFVMTLDCEYYIYAHNGGKFDFIFLIQERFLGNPCKIINGRIVSAKLGRHILRDSFAIMPIALKEFEKESIDYNLFTKEKREANKNDILHYLGTDCQNLYTLVAAFVERFGVQLTVGGTAIKQLRTFHPFEKQREGHDTKFRPYYFGGRVECFEHGIIKGDWKCYDVNSMYPYCMAYTKHPHGSANFDIEEFDVSMFDENFDVPGFEDTPYFISFQGNNRGALPYRTKTGLSFNIASGTFETMSHEFKVAIKYGLIDVHKINCITIPAETIIFDEYVAKFMRDKVEGKKSKDKIAELFAKFMLNSAYGKFGQNPAHYFDYLLRYPDDDIPDQNAQWALDQDCDGVEIWKRPSGIHAYYDVAIAASITSAARAVLLEAIQNATRPVYCDTDAIICEAFHPSFADKIDPYKLGAWDLEKQGTMMAIAGKKMYAMFNETPTTFDCVKLASKGVRLSPWDIIRLCKGETMNFKREAPNFKISGDYKYISRNITKTVDME